MQFIDLAQIHVKAGDGGNGCLSFRHEKYLAHGGPDGGDGGQGGGVIFEATRSLDTLLDLHRRQKIKAQRGEDGRGNDCQGASGEDVYVRVPVGTVVRDSQTGLILRDLKEDGEQVTVAKGGRGGFGNAHFASATNQVPRECEEGKPGESRDLELELKLLADVALVGLPNAGKSTLLNRLSAAKPKIGNYPFTTLKPSLGIVEVNLDQRFTLVDLPGLIEGAHKGVGLGDQFLRHMERCRVLCQLIDASGMDGVDPIEAFSVIEREILTYSQKLAQLPRVIALNKIEMVTNGEDLVKELQKQTDALILSISGHTGEGLEVLVKELSKRLS